MRVLLSLVAATAFVVASCSVPQVTDVTGFGCRSDSDCPGSHSCVDGSCRWVPPECATDSDCGPGAFCSEGSCVDNPAPGGCTSNAQCATGETCTSGACVASPTGCTSNAQCATDETCTNGACVAAPTGCTSNAQCATGETCTNGACVAAANQCTTATWGTFASSFFSTNCKSCHSWASTYSGVQSRASKVTSEIGSGSMPPGRALNASDETRILEWLGCGMPQ